MASCTMSPLQTPPPVLVVDRLPDEREHLLTLLANLDDEQWGRPTACPGWSVKDVALHLLGDDIGVLSRIRDGFSLASPSRRDELISFVNRLNDEWVRAAKRMSPRVLCDLLRWSGEQTYACFATLDPFRLGETVTWAGPDPAPQWLVIAREYTERWVHQQQIREALGAPPLTDSRLFAPVLATFARALPRTFRDVAAPPGTTVSLVIEGDSGGRWAVVRGRNARWDLYAGSPETAANATVRLDQETAWRLVTRGLNAEQAEHRARIEGDPDLGRQVLHTVAILA